MKHLAMSLVIGGLLTGPAFASLGTISLDVKSGGEENVVVPLGTMSIPIEVYFSATTSGTSGPNNGVQAVALDLDGTAMAGTPQTALAPDPTFTGLAILGGLGFDVLPVASTGGTGGVGIIAGIGNAQALPGSWSSVVDAANVGHAGNVLVATGTVDLNPGLAPGDHNVDLTGAGNLWAIGFGSTAPGDILTDTLVVTVLPEPASLLLLAPAALAFLRRRRTA